MNGISTHVLNTATGQPACGITVRLMRGDTEISCGITNSDGRCPALVPQGESLQAGFYQLVFELESSFPSSFYPEVAISFRVTDPQDHYHIPLLLSPFSYTTYRGS